MKHLSRSIIRLAGLTISGVAAFFLVCTSQASDRPNHSEIARLSAHIRDHPGDSVAIATRAFHWAEAGLPDLALKDYNKAISLTPKSADLWAAKAAVCLAMGNGKDAETCATVAIGFDPRNIHAHRTQAQLHFAAGRMDDALATANEGLAIDSTDARLWRIRARAHGAKGNLTAAISNLEAAVKNDASNAQAWADLGHHHYLNQNLPEALKAFENAYTIDRNMVEINLGLGRVHLALNNAASAKIALDRVVSAEPDRKPSLSQLYANIYCISGDAFFAKNDWKEAISHYEKSFDLQYDPHVHSKLAESHSRQIRHQLIVWRDPDGAAAQHKTATMKMPAHAAEISRKFAKAWVDWAESDSATSLVQLEAARDRLGRSLHVYPDKLVQFRLVELLVTMIDRYAPDSRLQSQLATTYSEALHYSSFDPTVNQWIRAKGKTLGL